MMALYEPRLLLSAALLCVTACQVAGPTAVPSESSSEERSAPIAGLERQVITDDYAVYAKSTAAADAIRVWLDHQLAAFRSTHSAALKGKGLVFAMEQGVELPPTVENWRKRYVDRSRPIEWTSPIRSQFFRSPHGRPYCLSSKPYFTESFELPPDDAVRLDIAPDGERPTWVCFLTTDEHVASAFDKTLRKMQYEHAQWVSDEVPIIVRLLSAPAVILFAAASEILIYPQWRLIDVDLMRLQRTETVRRALIRCSVNRPAVRERKSRALRDEIDDAWKRIWFRRPFD